MGDREDLINDLLAEEPAEDGTPQGTPSTDVDALLKEKDREIQGLLAAKKAEVSKRQRTQERLAQLEGAVNGILSTRQQAGMESVTEKEASDARSMGIPVNYDEDGNAWVDPNAVNQLVSPYEQKILELEQRLQQNQGQTEATAAAEKVRQAIFGEDERYGAVEGKYRAARKWVEDSVLDWSRDNGVNQAINSGDALNYVFDDLARQEFERQFPGMELFDVVTAEDSPDHFRRTLNNIATTMPNETGNTTMPGGMDSRFQKVLNKPSTLGNQANAKAGQLSVVDRIGNLSSEDIMELDDKSVDALMRAIEREERGE